MKIGILTFHWAANYGAVLQAYALKTACEKCGTEACIIDYYPKRFKKNILNACLTKQIKQIPARIKEIKKEQNIEKFRKKYFERTKYYNSNKSLRESSCSFDCYICGSDQVWNMSFTEKGERKKTFTYFLDFVPDNKIISSYAASFGTTECKENLKKDIKEHLNRFDFISVREKSGVDIIRQLGINKCELVPDPTLLLETKSYEEMLRNSKYLGKYAFLYMLHNREKDAEILVNKVIKSGLKIIKSDNEEVEQWLTNIYNAEIVITNSFHAVVFSIIFKVPFVALLIKNSGMNDRIITLLRNVGLEDRIFFGNEEIREVADIDWEMVHKKIAQMRNTGYEYIRKIIAHKKS